MYTGDDDALSDVNVVASNRCYCRRIRMRTFPVHVRIQFRWGRRRLVGWLVIWEFLPDKSSRATNMVFTNAYIIMLCVCVGAVSESRLEDNGRL